MSAPKAPPPTSFRSNALQSPNAAQSPLLVGTEPNSTHQSRSGGPRTLHLTLGSVVATSPSTSTSSNVVHIPNDSSTTFDADAPTSTRSFSPSINSPKVPGSSALSPSPTVTKFRRDAAARKRSSISYLPLNPQSPSPLQTNRHDGISSPLSSSHARAAFSLDGTKLAGSGLARSNSLGGRASRTPKSATFGERSSTGSMLNADANFANGVEHLKERPPATLSEKHADLLHFIAQKESKCLELRSQLAVHEAELLQLKKKWERIVNRGFERALTPNSTSTASSTYFLSPSPSHSSSVLPESASPNTNSPAYFSTLNSNNSNATGAVVLEGIKEGVQGMSRLIAAGLGSIAQVNAPQTNEQRSRQSQTPDGTGPMPLRLGLISHRSVHSSDGNGSGHGQKESQSSSSTNASHATSLSFLSASSTSSATSAGSRSSLTAETAKEPSTGGASPGLEAGSDFGDFEDGQAQGSRTRSSTLTEHLIVQDTGATPMMSPNPNFGRRKFRAPSPPPVADAHRGVDTAKDDFDWGDDWDEPAGEAQAADLFASGSGADKQGNERAPVPLDLHERSSLSSLSSGRNPATEVGSRSPSTPFHGLAMMDQGTSAQQMSSWVGSVGKKWGEIKGSSTFTKNQKRASVLLSDIQQTLVASLISPTPATSSASYFTPNTPPPPPAPFTSSAVGGFNLPTAQPGMQLPKAKRGVSLLDDSDDESFGESCEDANVTMHSALPSRMSAPVLVPDTVPRAATAKIGKTSAVTLKSAADEDDWNW
ncbi:hypothetical protein HYPSUDRAFT_213011 [Hypholoma sublateritium FD-334 SS-4]|uniref:Uncharacterized protein n=1 Tax=Hypholoma sublateritium (strain FD-334 SS-4) TaxID=945553 RepID=A0A0D2MSB5_HYPSF|nr:hypothetical protein HYPSUDRAFT_213011 [Hypholoma sublateritium FD-334 SS-4]